MQSDDWGAQALGTRTLVTRDFMDHAVCGVSFIAQAANSYHWVRAESFSDAMATTKCHCIDT